MEDLSPQGKQQTHVPLIKTRQIVESVNTSPTKLASEVVFQPVATMHLGDKKIYVRPLNNTVSRPVSPGVVSPTGKVAIHGERMVDLSQGLHSEVKTKVTKKVNNLLPTNPTQTAQKYVRPEDLSLQHPNLIPAKPTPVKPVQPQPRPQLQSLPAKPTPVLKPATDQVVQNKEQLKNQLDEINRILFEQIKQKIASELARQSKGVQPDLNHVETQPKTVEKEALDRKQEKPPAPSVQPTAAPKTPEVEKAQAETKQQTDNKDNYHLKEKLERPKISTEVPAHWEQSTKQAPTQKTTPPQITGLEKTDYQNQITRLEDEVKILIKEVENLDKTVQAVEQEKENTELATLERRIEIDQQMLSSIAEWRLALNNLINSHSIALKYLREKVDVQSQKTNHEDKHNQLHKAAAKLPAAASVATSFPPLPTIPPIQPPLVPSATAKPTTPIPDKPSEEQKESGREVQPASFEAVRNLVKQAMDKEKQQTPAPETLKPEQVKDLIKEEIKTEKQGEPKPSQPDTSLVQDLVKETLRQELPKAVEQVPPKGTANTVYVKEVDKNAVIPENAQTGVIIKEQPTINTADIEKQILEQAEKEEAVREAVRKAKDDAVKKIKDEKEKKEQASSAGEKPGPSQVKLVDASEELIKSEVEKLKSSLTTIDSKQMANLSKEDRTGMIKQLENLERQTTVAKQYDDIKAAAERRRINSQLAGMLHKLGEKAPEQLPSNQKPEQKMQNLKVEEKKQTSPAQKAAMIAEIKELERQSQARKAAEMSRPAVKAQPAYGKMLPNTPTIPNVINGIVKDNKGLLLSTVVLIVKDSEGEPVRAFKTNKLGQFALSTPVPNGVYKLELEKEGYDFDIIEVDVNGAIMQPIEIKAK